MTNDSESVIRPSSIVATLSQYPSKRIAFFTIKDNSQGPKWTKIGKVNDFIRRYSDHYCIVKGTQGGIHFHAIAGIKKNVTIRCQRGIHTYIKYLDHEEGGYADYSELAQSKLLCEYLIQQRFEQVTYSLTLSQQANLQIIVSSIKKYHLKKLNKIKVKKRLTKKQKSIMDIIVYLQKNLDEPRDDSIMEYIDYILKV